MKRKLFLLCSCIMAGILAGRGGTTNRLHFTASRFSIAPLEAPLEKALLEPVIMCLPATEGFAPNVNVMIQPYVGTIDDYSALSMGQFKDGGLKVLLHKKLGKSAVVFEYTGELQGRQLHWYARAEKSAGSVYLVTATAANEQWDKAAARLKSCVDSFSCDQVTPTGTASPN